MKVIACVDDHMGMCFNGRRVSRDRVVTEDILKMTTDSTLWMAPESEKLFADYLEQENRKDWKAVPDYLKMAGAGDYCFVEKNEIKEFESKIIEIVLYRWNRSYPADLVLDMDFSGWKMKEKTEFSGHSHEKITKEIYSRQG